MKRTDRESGKFSRPFFVFCAGIFQQGDFGVSGGWNPPRLWGSGFRGNPPKYR